MNGNPLAIDVGTLSSNTLRLTLRKDRFRDDRIECGRDTKYGVIEGSFSLQPIIHRMNMRKSLLTNAPSPACLQTDGNCLCALPFLSYRFVRAGRIAEYNR